MSRLSKTSSGIRPERKKLKVGRPQDFIDAAGIVERMRGKLDRRYLAKWAKKLGIVAELAHISGRERGA